MSFKPGQEILRSQPFGHVVSKDLAGQVCDACVKRPASTLSRCSGCKHVRYCNVKCQKSAWTVHKEECVYLKKVSPKIPPDTVRLLARILFKLKAGGAREIATLPDGSKRAFYDLMTHSKSVIRDEERTDAFDAYFHVLSDCIEVIPKQDLFEIYCKVLINSFNIMDDDYLPVGIGLYLGPSTLDHSCRPNATVVFTGKTILVRCIEAIDKFENVRISYTNVINEKERRHSDLKRQYYFDCQCDECRLQSEGSVARESLKLGSVKCINCSNSVAISDPNCCNRGIPVDSHKRLAKEVTEMLVENKTEHPEPMEQCQELYNDMKDVFSPCDSKFLMVLEHLYETYISESNWDRAFEVGCLTLEAYKKLYPRFDVNTGLILLKLGKLASHMELDDKAEDLLKEAKAQLKVTHGPFHKIFTETLPALFTELKMAQNDALVATKKSG